MPLTEIELTSPPSPLPAGIRELLDVADQRIDAFIHSRASTAHGFVASDHVAVYRALHEITQRDLAPGGAFCEWGSGFGVATLLAAQLGYDAAGIEIDPQLVHEAIDLAAATRLDAEFVAGSFVPRGGEALAEEAFSLSDSGNFWLSTDADDAYEQLGLDVDDFDLIFAYPWPGEAECLETIFHHFAADGALLLSYAHLESMRLVRKV